MIKQIQPYFDSEDKKSLNEVFNSSFITEGKINEKFENIIKKKLGYSYALTVPNWTLGIYSILIDLKKNNPNSNEIILPSLTFIASYTSVKMAGLKPVLCDIDRKSFNIDPNSISKLINKKTLAIMVVHNYGFPADMDKIQKIAKRNNIKVIEDAASALGSKYKKKYVGGLNYAGGFSLYGNKMITTGEGGIIVTNKKKVYDNIKKLKNFGRENKGTYVHDSEGYNFKFTDLQAALGITQFKKLNKIISHKKKIYFLYRKYLKNVQEVEFQEYDKNISEPTFWFTNIIVSKKKLLMKYLRKLNIETRELFLPLNRQKFISNSFSKKFVNSSFVYDNGFSLPSHMLINPKQVKYISKEIKNFYNKY